MPTPKRDPRILSFTPTLRKPEPAKTLSGAAETHRAARRLIDHVQVLIYADPEAIEILERDAATFRQMAQQPRRDDPFNR
jgi:hypothetical protein